MTAAYDKIKSTFDAHCMAAVTEIETQMLLNGDIATAFSKLDIDDVVNVDEKVKSSAPLIGWGTETVDESPRAPLYSACFRVVFRLPNDASNAAQAKAIALLQPFFRPGSAINIGDFLDDALTGQVFGRMYFSRTTVMPAGADADASIREIRVEAKASCRS